MFSKQLSTYLISLTFLVLVIINDTTSAAPIPFSQGNDSKSNLMKRAEFGIPPPVFYNQQNYSPAIYHDQNTKTKPSSRKSSTKQSRKSSTAATVKNGSSPLSGKLEKRPSMNGGSNKQAKTHHQQQQQQQQQAPSSSNQRIIQWTGMNELRKTIPRTKSMSESWWKQDENDENESPKHHRTNHHRKH